MVGTRIRRKREALGISQNELAKKLGYKSRSSIAKIENDGRNLPQDKIYAIAVALETTPAYIMGWEEADTTQEFLEALKALNLTEDEREDVITYAKFIKSKRKW